MTDRITGIVLLIFAIIYGFGATRLKVGFGSGVIGPKDFPIMLAVILGIIALAMMIKTDPNPTWPSLKSWLNLITIVVSFIIYAYLIRILGFILATTLSTAFLSYKFSAKWWQALIVGLSSSLLMYAIFVFGFDLGLPLGTIFGGR
jgi:putative tricarboxylic transport membrane protein